jgi:hypothetical protein
MAGEGALIRWSLDSDATAPPLCRAGTAKATIGDAGRYRPTVAQCSRPAPETAVMGAFSDGVAEDAVWLWRTNGGAQQARSGRLMSDGLVGRWHHCPGVLAVMARRLAYSSRMTRNGLPFAGSTLQTDALRAFPRGASTPIGMLAVDGDGSAWNAVSIADHKLAAISAD